MGQQDARKVQCLRWNRSSDPRSLLVQARALNLTSANVKYVD
jgi:hypothetical protein